MTLLSKAVAYGNACLAGKMTVNTRFGTKVAVLAGDFLFAQSSWYLANLDNLEVPILPPLSSAICTHCGFASALSGSSCLECACPTLGNWDQGCLRPEMRCGAVWCR